tara:strand:- start:7072 stop:7806 length:735 start_codon:yes stop_codon:yes gene_type:complete
MENHSYAIQIFNNHFKFANLRKNDCILELGPGDSISTAIIAYYYDLKSILVDNGNFASKNLSSYINLIKHLNFNKDKKEYLLSSKSVDEILAKCNSKYYTNGIKDIKKISDNSVDFIFSNAVLEHVFLCDFNQLISLLYKILKKNNLMSHQVDLRDHLANNLNHLRFSKRIWESNLFKKSGFYTNRINYKEMISIFELINFKILNVDKDNWKKLPINKNKLNKEFNNLSNDILKVKSFHILLQK